MIPHCYFMGENAEKYRGMVRYQYVLVEATAEEVTVMDKK